MLSAFQCRERIPSYTVTFVTPLGWRNSWDEVTKVPTSWNFLGDSDPESVSDIGENDDRLLADGNDVHMADEE